MEYMENQLFPYSAKGVYRLIVNLIYERIIMIIILRNDILPVLGLHILDLEHFKVLGGLVFCVHPLPRANMGRVYFPYTP